MKYRRMGNGHCSGEELAGPVPRFPPGFQYLSIGRDDRFLAVHNPDARITVLECSSNLREYLGVHEVVVRTKEMDPVTEREVESFVPRVVDAPILFGLPERDRAFIISDDIKGAVSGRSVDDDEFLVGIALAGHAVDTGLQRIHAVVRCRYNGESRFMGFHGQFLLRCFSKPITSVRPAPIRYLAGPGWSPRRNTVVPRWTEAYHKLRGKSVGGEGRERTADITSAVSGFLLCK